MLFDRARLLMTPGLACHAPSPGYYRLCFAWASRGALREGLARLGRLLTETMPGS